MNDQSEKRDELRRLIIAYGMIGQFIYDVASVISQMMKQRVFWKNSMPQRAKRMKTAETDGWT